MQIRALGWPHISHVLCVALGLKPHEIADSRVFWPLQKRHGFDLIVNWWKGWRLRGFAPPGRPTTYAVFWSRPGWGGAGAGLAGAPFPTPPPPTAGALGSCGPTCTPGGAGFPSCGRPQPLAPNGFRAVTPEPARERASVSRVPPPRIYGPVRPSPDSRPEPSS